MSSGSGSLDILTNTYKQVIDDVVKNMKEEYLNEGADIEMLEELKTLWLTKLSQTGAVNRPPRAEPPPRSTPVSQTKLYELANVVSAQPSAPSGTVPTPTASPTKPMITGASPSLSSSMTSSVVGVVSGSSPSSHQQRATVVSSVGKTLSQLPSRPPPALLHVPSTTETSSATPSQSRVQADATTSSVIQQAPPRSQQATPITTAESAAAAQQLAATPIATPSVVFHPSMLAAAALQQQANQSASSNSGAATILTPSTAPSVMEALLQQLALGGGVPTVVSGATATPAVNPFGAALNLMNHAASGMVPVQTAQGTMLIPLQAYLTLQQLKQAQQQHLAAAMAASAGGETASNDDSGGGSAEVHQIDGLPPVLRGSSHRAMMDVRGHEITGTESVITKIGRASSTLTGEAFGSYLRENERRGERGVVYQSEGLVPNIPAMQIYCGDASVGKVGSPLSSSFDAECEYFEISSSVSKKTEQTVSSPRPQQFLVHTSSKFLESENPNHSPNLQSSFHKKKKGGKAAISPNAEVIVQLDGPMAGGGRGSKVIVQLDGNGSSSEEDSDADEDSSEDEDEGAGVAAEAEENDDEPLNSDDDVSDANSDNEGGDFETEDTIVCQWEKVYRVKNKWKFQLKDGVMHIGGFDYVFHKTNGEADW